MMNATPKTPIATRTKTDTNKKLKGMRRLFPEVSPEMALLVYRVAYIGLVIGAILVAISTLVAFWSDAEIKRHDSLRLSANELATAEAVADSAKSKQLLAELTVEAERLRSDNLALQKVMQPRRLGAPIVIFNPDDPPPDVPIEKQFGEMRKFEGTPVLIQVVPDFEAKMLAKDMLFALSAYGLKPTLVTEAESKVSPLAIMEGVRVTYTRGGKYQEAAHALADAFTRAGLTGAVATSFGKVGAQQKEPLPIFAHGMAVDKEGKPSDMPNDPKFDSSIDAIIVQVGIKPIPVADSPGSVSAR